MLDQRRNELRRGQQRVALKVDDEVEIGVELVERFGAALGAIARRF